MDIKWCPALGDKYARSAKRELFRAVINCSVLRRVISLFLPVETDDEQIEDRGVGGQVVEGEPSVADVGSELPAAGQDVHGEEGHGNEADGKVRHGQAEEEIIGDGLELLVDLEGDHDHAVAGHGEEAEESGHDGDEHHLRIGIRKDKVVLGRRQVALVAAGHARHHRLKFRHDPNRRRCRRSRQVAQSHSSTQNTSGWIVARRTLQQRLHSESFSLFSLPKEMVKNRCSGMSWMRGRSGPASPGN